MTGWSGGYVGDLEYRPGYYGDLAPAQLDLACLLNGLAPPETRPDFTYCELGCGEGLTATVLAAANPAARVVGVDFNPAHIARARARARAAGLSNVTFLEASFDALAEDPDALPELDYVALHGVYTWVAPAQRAAIRRLLARHVAPGGLVYVGYNALPGWTSALPLQHLIAAFAAETPGASDARVAAAIARTRRLARAGNIFLKDNPFLQSIEQAEATGELAYLAHEYLSRHWEPMFHSTLAGELAEAKLDFAGSTAKVYNFPALVLEEAHREIRAGVADPAFAEELKDYASGRSFRRDVFVRGRRVLAPHERDARLCELRLALVAPRDAVSTRVAVPAGEVQLQEDVYGPMLDALAGEGPMTVDALMRLPTVRTGARHSPAEIAGLLTATEGVVPARPASAETAPGIALNSLAAREAVAAAANHKGALAAPALGTGLATSSLELAVLGLMPQRGAADPAALAEAVWAPLRARGEALVKDGEPVEGDAANLALVEERVRAIIEKKLPVWRRHAALPPALAAPGAAA